MPLGLPSTSVLSVDLVRVYTGCTMQASVATAIPNASLTKIEQQEEYDTYERSLRSSLASAHGQIAKNNTWV